MGEFSIGKRVCKPVGRGRVSTITFWVPVDVGALVEFVSVEFSVSAKEGTAEIVG